jgi:hypothetical protein
MCSGKTSFSTELTIFRFSQLTVFLHEIDIGERAILEIFSFFHIISIAKIIALMKIFAFLD